MVSHTPPPRRAGAALRLIGAIILVLGLGGAGLVYCLSTPPDASSDEVLRSSNSKRVQRAIEVNVGKMGVVMDGLAEDLEDPATKAIVLAAISLLLGAGCFYFAHLQARGAELDEFEDPPHY
jgi:hypothetical protein